MVDQANSSPTCSVVHMVLVHGHIKNKQLNINTGQMIAQSIHEHKLYHYYGQLIPIKENIIINN